MWPIPCLCWGAGFPLFCSLSLFFCCWLRRWLDVCLYPRMNCGGMCQALFGFLGLGMRWCCSTHLEQFEWLEKYWLGLAGAQLEIVLLWRQIVFHSELDLLQTERSCIAHVSLWSPRRQDTSPVSCFTSPTSYSIYVSCLLSKDLYLSLYLHTAAVVSHRT